MMMMNGNDWVFGFGLGWLWMAVPLAIAGLVIAALVKYLAK